MWKDIPEDLNEKIRSRRGNKKPEKSGCTQKGNNCDSNDGQNYVGLEKVREDVGPHVLLLDYDAEVNPYYAIGVVQVLYVLEVRVQ